MYNCNFILKQYTYWVYEYPKYGSARKIIIKIIIGIPNIGPSVFANTEPVNGAPVPIAFTTGIPLTVSIKIINKLISI